MNKKITVMKLTKKGDIRAFYWKSIKTTDLDNFLIVECNFLKKNKSLCCHPSWLWQLILLKFNFVYIRFRRRQRKRGNCNGKISVKNIFIYHCYRDVLLKKLEDFADRGVPNWNEHSAEIEAKNILTKMDRQKSHQYELIEQLKNQVPIQRPAQQYVTSYNLWYFSFSLTTSRSMLMTQGSRFCLKQSWSKSKKLFLRSWNRKWI